MITENQIKKIPLALLTGLGAYGGFPTPPNWFQKMAKFRGFQFIVLWILVFQGGGGESILLTSIVSIFIYLIMEISKVIERKNTHQIKQENNQQIKQENTQQIKQENTELNNNSLITPNVKLESSQNSEEYNS
tara:strand:- start:2187 stop:2585 length:399 start_codon:yes stop_codon:yes gene_type:complete